MKDNYRKNIINDCIAAMEADEYYITRLRGDDTKAINIDLEALKLLRDYYAGKQITVLI